MAHVIVVGSYNTDLAIEVARFPTPGETVLGGRLRRGPGGKGSNQAIAAARLGARVHFIGRIGNDDFGKEALARLKREGIDPSGLIVDAEAPTGMAVIFVEENGENEIVVVPGANGNLSVEDVERVRPVFSARSVLLAQLEVPMPAVARAAQIAREIKGLAILNPAPANREAAKLLPLFDLVVLNQREAELMAGVRIDGLKTAEEAAGRLLSLGVSAVVITMGARGSLYVSSAKRIFTPPFMVSVRDTTGAGDAFNGALAFALADEQPLEDALRFANAAAALSVTRPGAADSMPSREEVNDLLLRITAD